MLDLAMAVQPAWPWRQPQLMQKNYLFFTISFCEIATEETERISKFELPQQEPTEIA